MLLKCEECGGFLKLDGKVCVCSECGKIFSLEDEENIVVNEEIKEKSSEKSDKKLIVFLLAIVVLIFGLGYYFVNSSINSEQDRNEEMVNLITSTCFDEYNSTVKFKGYTFGEIVETFHNLNPDNNKIKFQCNSDISLYHSLSKSIKNFNYKKYDYVRGLMSWKNPKDSTVNEKYNILFSIDKKTNEIIPIATSPDGSEWVYSEYPSDVITAFYMILGTSLDMANISIDSEKNINSSSAFNNIKRNGDYVYFDMSVSEFVERYNNSLSGDAEYISNSLIVPDNYSNSGVGVQQNTIYQYNLTNNSNSQYGSVYVYAHTNKDGKILEMSIALKKQFGKPNVNQVDILYNDLFKIANCLVGISEKEWMLYADGLSEKILNKESRLYYYDKGLLLDTYSNEDAVYYRVSCMSENLFNKVMSN